jgi:hypothetical protein
MRKSSGESAGGAPSQFIDARIKELDDWRGETLARLRGLIKEADAGVVEEWKWGGPVWSHDGLICTGESYKSVVKLTFAKGAQLKDPRKLFNSSPLKETPGGPSISAKARRSMRLPSRL